MSAFFEKLLEFIKEVRFWYVVRPWEQAVRIRLGKNANLISSGWHWKLPVLDEVVIINSRLRLAPVTFQTITTKDGKVITVGAAIGFYITDPLLALSSFQRPEASYSALAHNYIAEYFTSRTLEAINFKELELFIVGQLEQYNYGIKMEFAKITNFVHAKTYRIVGDSNIYLDALSTSPHQNEYGPVTQW